MSNNDKDDKDDNNDDNKKSQQHHHHHSSQRAGNARQYPRFVRQLAAAHPAAAQRALNAQFAGQSQILYEDFEHGVRQQMFGGGALPPVADLCLLWAAFRGETESLRLGLAESGAEVEGNQRE